MTMSEAATLVTCPSCGATNRVDPDRIGGDQEAVCGRCKAPLAGSGPLTVTDESFDELVLRSPVPVLLDAWAAWCAPCRMIAPALEQVASERSGRLRVAKLNVDDSPATAERLGVRSIPTLVLFRDGREVDRVVGALPKGEILRWADAACPAS
jgi:thioredoxin 2